MKSNLISTIGIIICSFIGSAHAVSTQLTLVKAVIGGEAAVTDWVLTADGTDANDLSGAGFISGFVDPDTFLLSESAGPSWYAAGDWICTGGGIQEGAQITLSLGDIATCTIINTHEPPVVIFDTDFALPSLPVGDGAGTPVCIDEVSGLLVVGCDAAGDIAAVTAGNGLTGGGDSGSVSLSADTAYLQRRVSGSCSVDNAIRTIDADGSVTCQPTPLTTYSAGTGLDLSGTTFIADPSDYNSIPQRTAASGNGMAPTTTDWVTSYSDSITAPGVAGRVIAIAGIEFRAVSFGGLSAAIRFGLTTSSTGAPADYSRHYVQNVIGLTYQHSSSHAVFSVAANSTTTVYYRSYSEDTDDSWFLYSPRILLFFIPN